MILEQRKRDWDLQRIRFYLIFVFGLVLAVAFVACGPAGQPDIQLASDHVALGTVTNGQVEQFEVEVRNDGSAPLTIEAVTTSCGCTSASVSPETIQAGEAGILAVSYDSGAHGPEFSGEVERQVFIASNDPDTREVILDLSANVVLEDG
jgi:hypothetical protein